MVSLEEIFSAPRRTARSFGELLPWFGMIAEDVVLCHDGSIIAGFAYEGSDIEGVLDDDVNRRIDLLQTGLRQLTDRITIWSVQRRRTATEYPRASFTNRVAQIIDEHWGERCTDVPNARLEHRIYLGYSFPNATEALFEQLKSELELAKNPFVALGSVLTRRLSGGSAIAKVRGQLTEMQDDFENIAGSFASIVSVGLGLRRMGGSELLGDLYSLANLASPVGPVAVPARPVYLNTLLPADDIVRQGSYLEFKGPSRSVFCAALSTTGMPPEACSVQLDALMGLPCEYVVVQSFKLIDAYAAETTIQKSEQHYRMEVKSTTTRMFEQITGVDTGKVNTGNLELAADAQAALVELTAGDLSYGWYSMTILALGSSQREAERGCDMISSTLRTSGYTITRERQGLLPAFLGTLPGNHGAQIRKYLASTANLADLAPIRTISRGEPSHGLFSAVLNRPVPAHTRFLTPYGIPFDFNLHDQDLGHTVVIGGSGSGKSTGMSLLIAMFQKYYPCQTFVFDKDNSMALMCCLLGGANIDMATPGVNGPRINPVRRMLVDGNPMALLRWLDVLMSSGDEGRLKPEDKETVNAAIQKLMSLGAANWRLGTLYTLLHGTDRRLALKLSPYVDRSDDEGGMFAKGPFADYFDNEEDSFSLGSIVCMETGKLLQSPEIAAPFMDYAFYCIDNKLDGQTPTLIYVEEAWYMLKNPTFEHKMDEWLRVFRKKRAFVIFASQSPQEFGNLESWPAFAANVPTRIFLPSINDSISTTAGIYKQLFNLNDAQLDLLANAVPKRHYLLVKSGITRLVDAYMPRLIVAINEGTARKDIREHALGMSQSGEPDWQVQFIREVLNVNV